MSPLATLQQCLYNAAQRHNGRPNQVVASSWTGQNLTPYLAALLRLPYRINPTLRIHNTKKQGLYLPTLGSERLKIFAFSDNTLMISATDFIKSLLPSTPIPRFAFFTSHQIPR